MPLAFAALLFLALPAAAEERDTALGRAESGVLLGLAEAGTRLVAVGDRGSVLLSDDAGVHWRLAADPVRVLLTDVLFTDASHGFAVGQDATVIATEDGGAHWVKRAEKPGSDNALFSVASLGGGQLLATGAYNLLLASADGGAHWTAGSIPNLDEDYHLNCVVATGGDGVAVAGESGHVFLRRAGQWTSVPVPYGGSQFGCLLARDGTLYSFGLRGSLFARPSAAGAAGWRRLDTGTQSSLFGGVELRDGRLAFVGANGLMLVFDPKSARIERLESGSTASLSAVVEEDGALVFVGDDGVHRLALAAATADAR